MDETQFLGYLVSAIITLGAFIVVIQRLTQPINDLRVVIQELRDCVKALRDDNTAHSNELREHDKEINELKGRMDKAELKINMYHSND